MPDSHFADPELAALYDLLDGDRSDLAAYEALVDEVGARRVIDLGCGTGTFACRLAARDIEVIAVDPASASLDIARRKPHADRVEWVHGDASNVAVSEVDLVTMTGNVAQVFLSDEDWRTVLGVAHAALRPRGALVFEVRDPGRRAWETWDRDVTERRTRVPDVGWVRTWTELTAVELPFVSFRHVFEFERVSNVLTSDSTLRFRSHEEIVDSLERTGFTLADVRDAPDRPSLELVFIADRQERPDQGSRST